MGVYRKSVHVSIMAALLFGMYGYVYAASATSEKVLRPAVYEDYCKKNKKTLIYFNVSNGKIDWEGSYPVEAKLSSVTVRFLDNRGKEHAGVPSVFIQCATYAADKKYKNQKDAEFQTSIARFPVYNSAGATNSNYPTEYQASTVETGYGSLHGSEYVDKAAVRVADVLPVARTVEITNKIPGEPSEHRIADIVGSDPARLSAVSQNSFESVHVISVANQYSEKPIVFTGTLVPRTLADAANQNIPVSPVKQASFSWPNVFHTIQTLLSL